MDLYIDMVIQSHLSDAIIETSVNPKLARKRIKFVKKLLFIKKREKIVMTSEERLDEIWGEIKDEIEDV